MVILLHCLCSNYHATWYIMHVWTILTSSKIDQRIHYHWIALEIDKILSKDHHMIKKFVTDLLAYSVWLYKGKYRNLWLSFEWIDFHLKIKHLLKSSKGLPLILFNKCGYVSKNLNPLVNFWSFLQRHFKDGEEGRLY